jgi:hypothetical protein
MPFTIGVLGINSNKPLGRKKFGSKIQVLNEITNKDRVGRYYDRYQFFSSLPGILYDLQECEDNFIEGDEIFNLLIGNDKYNLDTLPFWTVGEKYKYDLFYLSINNTYREDFIRCIKIILDQSPDKMIAVHIGIEGSYVETICGTMTLEKFIEYLDGNKIRTNIIYIIKESIIPNIDWVAAD